MAAATRASRGFTRKFLSSFESEFTLSDLDIMSVNADGSRHSTTGHLEDSKAGKPVSASPSSGTQHMKEGTAAPAADDRPGELWSDCRKYRGDSGDARCSGTCHSCARPGNRKHGEPAGTEEKLPSANTEGDFSTIEGFT